MPKKPPYRVGAIESSSDTEVKFYGYGTYVGDEMGSGLPFPNPKIELDSKKLVWGCQCWWGPEEKIKEVIDSKVAKGAVVVEVVPEDISD